MIQTRDERPMQGRQHGAGNIDYRTVDLGYCTGLNKLVIDGCGKPYCA